MCQCQTWCFCCTNRGVTILATVLSVITSCFLAVMAVSLTIDLVTNITEASTVVRDYIDILGSMTLCFVFIAATICLLIAVIKNGLDTLVVIWLAVAMAFIGFSVVFPFFGPDEDMHVDEGERTAKETTILTIVALSIVFLWDAFLGYDRIRTREGAKPGSNCDSFAITGSGAVVKALQFDLGFEFGDGMQRDIYIWCGVLSYYWMLRDKRMGFYDSTEL